MKRNIGFLLALTCMTLFAIMSFYYAENEKTAHVPMISHSQYMAVKSHHPLMGEPKPDENNHEETSNTQNQGYMTMGGIDAEIKKIDGEINIGDFVAKANNGALSDGELSHLRSLLKKRDQMFTMKAQLLLNEFE